MVDGSVVVEVAEEGSGKKTNEDTGIDNDDTGIYRASDTGEYQRLTGGLTLLTQRGYSWQNDVNLVKINKTIVEYG